MLSEPRALDWYLRKRSKGGGGEAEILKMGRKDESGKRERENQGKRLQSEIVGGDWTDDQGWDTAKRQARLGAWDCWQSSGKERQHRWMSPGMSK